MPNMPNMPKISLSTLLVVAALAAPVTAAASPPRDSSGTNLITSNNIVDVRQAGPVTFLSFSGTTVLAGTLMGTTDARSEVIVVPSGATILFGDLVCACTVEGRTGTIVVSFVGHGDPTGAFSGHYTLQHGTGELTSLRGHGRFAGVGALVPGLVITYAGEHNFDGA